MLSIYYYKIASKVSLPCNPNRAHAVFGIASEPNHYTISTRDTISAITIQDKQENPRGASLHLIKQWSL